LSLLGIPAELQTRRDTKAAKVSSTSETLWCAQAGKSSEAIGVGARLPDLVMDNSLLEERFEILFSILLDGV
jgi:hypothetical protein